MSNPMKYIRDLEAAGFERAQAEAQVQVVLDALEGDVVENLVTKSDFALFKEQVDNRFARVEMQIKESEFRTVTRLGLINVSTISIAVAFLAWLIK